MNFQRLTEEKLYQKILATLLSDYDLACKHEILIHQNSGCDCLNNAALKAAQEIKNSIVFPETCSNCGVLGLPSNERGNIDACRKMVSPFVSDFRFCLERSIGISGDIKSFSYRYGNSTIQCKQPFVSPFRKSTHVVNKIYTVSDLILRLKLSLINHKTISSNLMKYTSVVISDLLGGTLCLHRMYLSLCSIQDDSGETCKSRVLQDVYRYVLEVLSKIATLDVNKTSTFDLVSIVLPCFPCNKPGQSCFRMVLNSLNSLCLLTNIVIQAMVFSKSGPPLDTLRHLTHELTEDTNPSWLLWACGVSLPCMVVNKGSKKETNKAKPVVYTPATFQAQKREVFSKNAVMLHGKTITKNRMEVRAK